MWGDVGDSGENVCNLPIGHYPIKLAITKTENNVPSFKGQFEHSVDNKGRVAFPAKLRKLLSPDAQDNFTVVRGLEPCLHLYPQDQWETVENRLSKINKFTQKGRTVIRNLLRHAEDLSLDKQNRISLPSGLMSYSDISSTAIFIGMGNYIEIWNPDNLNKLDENLTQETYQELFEQVLGDEHEFEE